MLKFIDIVFIICLMSLGYYFFGENKKIEELSSVEMQPTQENISKESFVFNDYFIEKRAKFEIYGKLLSRESYSFDLSSDISPIDFALGWNVMSDQKYLNQISISQGQRFYFWESSEMPLSAEAVSFNSANMHLIPKDNKIKKILNSANKRDIVYLKGYLVDVSKEGFEWKTSLTRKDVGDGACEIIFVEEAEIYKSGS